MSNRLRAFFISLSIFSLVMFSAFGTIPVYADDGTTSGSTETTTTTSTEPVATEQPVSDSSNTGDVEQPPTDGTTPTVETQPEEAPVPLLEQVPDNTTVTVVDETGEAQPLASQDSADAVLLSDPIWCPAGQAPTPGSNGCTQSYSSFTELLDFLKANEGDASYQQDGTIYVQQGAYAGGEESIDFNSYNFTELSKKNLTVTGGWDTNTNTVNSTSTLNIPIIIGSSGNPWGGSLTLNNIVIDGATDQTGLTLYSNGNIDLSNVEVTNSQNGAVINALGNVTIKNSKFHNNKEKGADISGGAVDVSSSDFSDNGSGDIGDPTGSGLGVKSAGAVTLMDVAANNNQLFGSNIQASGTVSITHGFFSGNQGIVYSYNWDYQGYGLQVVTSGDIVLSDITANDNYLFGASLTGAKVTVEAENSPAQSSFSNNGPGHDSVGYGLSVTGSDVISLYNIEANNNNLYGATVNGKSSVLVSNSYFNGNQSYEWSGNKIYFGSGLQVFAPTITLEKVSASENNLLGAYLEGNTIAVNGGSFIKNGLNTGMDLIGKGLEIVSKLPDNYVPGDVLPGVSLFNVIAENNKEFGTDIQAAGNVTIGTSSFSGQLTYVNDYDTPYGSSNISGGYGLKVVAGGDVVIADIVASGNYLYGASLDGSKVALTNSTFSSNGSGIMTAPAISNMGFGLKVNSKDNVTLTDVVANNNQQYGADIYATGNVSVGAIDSNKPSTFTGNQSVYLDPLNGLVFSGYGLTVYSELGNIIIGNVEANVNNLWGAKLNGMNIFITDSKFNNNVSDSSIFIDDTGLIVTSRGSLVVLSGVEAKNNRLIGAIIGNDPLANNIVDVNISNSNFSGNAGVTCSLSWCPAGSEIYHGYGLNVVTPGMITLFGVTANDNNLYGASLQGSSIFVSDSSFINNKFGNGLTINSTGDVNVINVTASGNGQNGVEVTTPACAVVQVSDGTFSNNAQYGLSVTGSILNATGTQTFSGNGAGNIFQNPATCAIVLSVNTANAPRVATVATTTNTTSTTTVSAGTTTNTKTVTAAKKATKTTKVKKAVVKKHKTQKTIKVRLARKGR